MRPHFADHPLRLPLTDPKLHEIAIVSDAELDLSRQIDDLLATDSYLRDKPGSWDFSLNRVILKRLGDTRTEYTNLAARLRADVEKRKSALCKFLANREAVQFRNLESVVHRQIGLHLHQHARRRWKWLDWPNIAQQAHSVVAQKLAILPADTNAEGFEAWLTGIAKRIAMNDSSKCQRHLSKAEELHSHVLAAAEFRQRSQGAEVQAAWTERQMLIRLVMNAPELTGLERTYIELRFDDERSTAEIASLLDKSPAALYVLWGRLRKKLAPKLIDKLMEE
jgi:DNA-directed RNA polymerase specialized sigma24 family protein